MSTTLTATELAKNIEHTILNMQAWIDEYKARAKRLNVIADEDSTPLKTEIEAFTFVADKAGGAMRVIQLLQTASPKAAEERIKLALDSAIKERNMGRIDALWEAYVGLTTKD